MKTNEIEIVGGWDGPRPFAVYSWSASGDSGALLETFHTRQEAVSFAATLEKCLGWNLHSANVVPRKAKGGAA